MAPFPVMEVRQRIAPTWARPDQVTFSVTQKSPTYTTIIPLGPSTTAEVDVVSTTPITTTAVSTPTQNAKVAFPRDTSSDSSDSGVVAGAVLGSVLGTLVLIALLYVCCFNNRAAFRIPSASRYYHSDTDSEGGSRSSRVYRRGGGGEGFGRGNRRGDRVRRPHRARTRYRHREESLSRIESSSGAWQRRRRRNSMSHYNGLFGWFLMPRTTRYGHRYFTKRHNRSSWARGGVRGTADD